ncbi:MAG: aspartyl/asparaginyl beta-hydroxylase domain-containing protein [Nitrospinae bacterium]|nr:aspartyl/asparaginyl beta-hydroxylase domain-containing protein [Nitrospinota bacterium]
MTSIMLSMLLIFSFILGSITYVYLYRGKARYENLGEYLRKGWPIFSPLNCLLYMFTQSKARHPIINLDNFHELDEIQNNWEVIREEVVNLYRQRYFELTKKPGSQAFYDIGFRTFFKYGWSRFYLKWYGYTHDSAKKLCPNTVRILEQIPSVNGAMFSILPVNGQLTRHLDPLACSLRYHLGLDTPNSDDCFINVDGVSYSWRNGKALLFDETYPHYARNDSDQYRLILMCDVERPMNFLGRFINFFYKGLMRLTVVPNIEGDKRGFANILFSGLAPVNPKLKALKQTNKKLYLLIKYTINLTLILLAFAIIAGLLQIGNTLAMTLVS